MMQNLTRASRELFSRTPDETFPSLEALHGHCLREQEESVDYWQSPDRLWTRPEGPDQLLLAGGEKEVYWLNDWSFGQLCRLAGVSKDTVNRLAAETASRVFEETMPRGSKPLQIYATGQQARSIHGASYTRLYNSELLEVVVQCADRFEPPPKGAGGGTGLYCGEQDLFLFLIDPNGWIDIGGEQFAPGMFLWNSEVGRRSLGIETFWYQAICANHIVWDAVEVIQYKRKHTANVHESLGDIRGIIQRLVAKRDARRDGFARVIKQAMETGLGDDADEVRAVLARNGVGRSMAKEAVEMASRQGQLTLFAVVDALTRLSGRIVNAGDRTEVDQRTGKLLTLAT
jgi:hypothetical protein